MLSALQGFDKSRLKATTTEVRHLTYISVDEAKPTGIGHNEDEDTLLYFDTPQLVTQKVKDTAELIKKTKHLVAFTGAGISTSANIRDYRGPNGLWTLTDLGYGSLSPSKDLTSAKPTLAHMALVGLYNQGILKGVVTTNLDGLHLRSGIPKEICSELHGSAFKEESVINFGQEIPKEQVELAESICSPCDLALVLGTSLRVAPACYYPEKSYKNRGYLIICNLQKTPYDKYSKVKIFAETDLFMLLLMKELGIPIPEKTVDGVEIPIKIIEGWEEKYLEAARVAEEKAKQHEEDLKKQQARAKLGPTKLILERELLFHRNVQKDMVVVANKSSTTETISVTSKNLLSFQNCSQSTFTITSPVTKIVAQGCTNTTLVLHNKILTGVLEIVNCNHHHIKFFHPVPTVVVEKVVGGVLWFLDEKTAMAGAVVSTQTTTGLRIAVGVQGEEEVRMEGHEDEKDVVQFVTKWKEGKLETVRANRQEGYFTL